VTGEKADSPTTLKWAVRLLYLECALLVLLTVFLIVQTFRSGAVSVPVVVGLIVMSLLATVAVYFIARGLGLRRRGYRGPAIVTQLFAIASGGFLLQTDPVWAGVLLILLGAGTGLLIVMPASTRALGIG
jgi:hypothetical protein